MSIRWLLLGGALLTINAGPTHAHDIYSDLVDELGWNCCSNTDCKSAQYRITATGVQMLLDQTWVTIPEKSIIYRTLEGDTGETRGGHWCGVYLYLERSFLTRCAVLPLNSASASDMHQQH